MTTPSTPKEPLKITVKCPSCSEMMIVHHAVPSGAGAESGENIVCVKCEREFPVNLPGPFVGGPFPKP